MRWIKKIKASITYFIASTLTMITGNVFFFVMYSALVNVWVHAHVLEYGHMYTVRLVSWSHLRFWKE